MQDRIAVLERDVATIKSEIDVLRRDRKDAAELIDRIDRMEGDITGIKRDVSMLQKDVMLLQRDVALLQKDVIRIEEELKRLNEEIVQIRMEIIRQNDALANCATKADLKALEANIKGWMLVIAIALLGTQLTMFSYLRSMGPAIHASAPQLDSIAPASRAVK